MPVHLFGQPCETEPIVALAKKYNLKIIEDCAEAHFATYKGKTIGNFGEVAGFSTYFAHTITTGVGGVVTTNDSELMEICRSLLAPLRTQTEMDRRFTFLRLG